MLRRRRHGATLLEVCLVLGLTGVVLAAFVPRFVDALRTSKVSEATEQLAVLHRQAATYWAAPPAGARRCLPAAAGPTPERPHERPVTVDFQAPDTKGSETWRALGFQPDRPVRYRYAFTPRAAGCDLGKRPGTDLVTMSAEGDLDGDGATSRFWRLAGMGVEGELVPIGVLYVSNRVE